MASGNEDESQKKTEKSASKAENENPAVTKSDSEKSSESAAAKGSSGIESSMTASQEEKDSVEKKSSGCNTSEDAKTEERDGNCYCGKERNLNIIELLCVHCNRWYHESCIGYQLGKIVPFMMNYTFVCKNCSPTGLESFRKTQALFPQMCVTAIANMMQASVKEGNPRVKFSKDRDIIPFIEAHWEGMTTIARRVTQSWHSTILKCLMKETKLLFNAEEDSSEDGPLYSLVVPDLTQIRPSYDEIKTKGGGVTPGGGGMKGRGGKRKLADTGQGGGKKGRLAGDVNAPKLPAHGYPLEHPYNKDGYRYILAEPDPHAPFRQEFDESSESAGKPIPGWLYRTLAPNKVFLALHDRAPQLRVADNRLKVTGEKGYCMIRATHCVNRGVWYYEATIQEMPEGSATRIGWGQEYANLQAPLGYDKFGYSWRSRKGTRFHEGRGKHYSPGYGVNDVLGFLIILPEEESTSYLPPTYKDRPLVKFRSHLYYEEKDQVAETLKQLHPLQGSKIVFFKNGQCQGDAFLDIYAGAYYPAVSLYKSCSVVVNFGPDFEHPPPKEQYSYRGMHEKSEESICEQVLSDLMYLVQNEGKLRLDSF
nr:PREDICTED: set1/Ash2 histone methyltransferase complex subunit ASH2 isoform X3 [Bemisia tabaci]